MARKHIDIPLPHESGSTGSALAFVCGSTCLPTMFISHNYVLGALLLLLTIVFIIVALGKSGIEFDLTDQLYRKYESYLAQKTGKWRSMKRLEYVAIRWHRTAGGEGPFALSGTRADSDSYIVRLEGKGISSIQLEVLDSHNEAIFRMHHYSELIQLPPRDYFEQRKESAAKRRREVEARTRERRSRK